MWDDQIIQNAAKGNMSTTQFLDFTKMKDPTDQCNVFGTTDAGSHASSFNGIDGLDLPEVI